MPNSAKMDYSKLLGFDMVADDAADGVDFQNANIGARLGAKVGKTLTVNPQPMRSSDLASDVTHAGGPIMLGLGGRTVSSS